MVFKLMAKLRLVVDPGTNPLEECQLVLVKPSNVVTVIPFVSIFPNVEVAQADPFQYFQVVRPSKETRYLMVVLVGVDWVMPTPVNWFQVEVLSWEVFV